MITRHEAIDLLEKFCQFMEEQGHIDADWRTEPPFAIDEFLARKEFKKLKWKARVEKKKGQTQ